MQSRNSSPYLFIVVGVIVLLISAYFLISTVSFQRKAIHTVGTIVSWSTLHRNAKTYYIPTVEYRDTNGNSYQIQGSGDANLTNPVVGGKVDVLYSSEDPSSGVLRNVLLIPSLAGILLGLVFSIVGIIVLRKKLSGPRLITPN